jgi:hypothetical protein
MIKEYNFTYKDYFINITYHLTGVVLASVRSDDDYFTKKYIDYTRTEIVEKIKKEIKERKAQNNENKNI